MSKKISRLSVILGVVFVFLISFAAHAAGFQTLPGIYDLDRNDPEYFALHGECYELTSKYGGDQVVLTGTTKPEWDSFISYAKSNSNIDVADCPVQYSGWSGGSCSASCGGGTLTETRSCIFEPSGATIPCEYCGGQCSRSSSCNEGACAGWQRSCPANPSLNTSNNPATCGKSCTVTCEADGQVVSNSECTGTPPSDYIAYPRSACESDKKSCQLPWGGTVPHNARVEAYLTASVASNETCTGETRVCNDGVLTGSYTYEDCAPEGAPVECTLPWGGTVADGERVTAYRTGSVPNGDQCDGETRICRNGSLTGSYTYEDCTPDPEDDPLGCTLPWGGSVENGESVTAYFSQTVAFGNTCNAETRVCRNGVLSGSYAYGSCTPQPPARCALPWGGSIAHNQSVNAYAASSVAYGNSCNGQVRMCNNGSLSGSYRYRACTVQPPADCTLPWGGTLEHGESVTTYQEETVPHDGTCRSENRTCNNGTLSGSYSEVTCMRDDPPVEECRIRKERITDWNTSRGTTRGCQILCQSKGLMSVRTDEGRVCESNETGNYPGKSTGLAWEDDSLRCYTPGQRHDGDRSDKTRYCYCGADSSCNGKAYTGGGGSSGGGGGGGTTDELEQEMNMIR